MSVDVRDTLQHVLETVENGQRGFAEGAEKLSKDGDGQLAAAFAQMSRERGLFADELRTLNPDLVASSGDGTAPGALHRVWLALRDAVSGDDAKGVLSAAEQGEDHAVKVYRDALDADGLPADARAVLSRQLDAIVASHDKVKLLRDQH